MATQAQATTTEFGREKVFGFILPAGSSGELVKQSVFAVMTAVFLAVIYIFFVFPRFSEIVSASLKVRQLEMNNNNLIKTLDALDRFKSDVSGVERENVGLAIPPRFDPGYILVSLRQLAVENQVSVVSYNLLGGELSDEASAGEDLVKHPVKIEVSGPPLNLINFVDSLDGYLPLAIVENLSISEVSRVLLTGAPNSRLGMTLTYYHLPVKTISAESLSGNLLNQKELDMVKSLGEYKHLGGTETTGAPTTTGNENLFGL